MRQAAAHAHAQARPSAADRRGYADANAALHEVIYRASGNPVLVAQVRAVRKTLAAYRQRSFDKPGRLVVSDREHARVVQAIVLGDDAAAAEAMREHIGAGGEAMVTDAGAGGRGGGLGRCGTGDAHPHGPARALTTPGQALRVFVRSPLGHELRHVAHR